jgi:FKBP-type peptidyl-prolyl cis-trans isomerase FkpA/FKBP-type peptidyl-prolyl cis-trans isomerase FklB
MRLSSFSLAALSAMALTLAGCKPKQVEAPAQPAQAKVMSESDKTLYALGAIISRNLESFQLTQPELDAVKRGLDDGVAGKTLEVELQTYGPKVDELHQTRMAAGAKKEAEAGVAYLAKAAAEPGARKTASGLIIKELTPGKGASPKATDRVKVHYRGTLIDGKEFDSSIKRGEPATFPLNGVIGCWTEGLQLMKVGGKSQLVCPSALAYGERGSPPMIKPGSTLVFEVELLEIVK